MVFKNKPSICSETIRKFIKRFDSITDSWDGRIDFVLQEADVYLWTVAFNPTINDNEKINISKIPKSGTFILLK